MSNISEHELQEAHDKLRDQFAMAALTGRLAVDAHPLSHGPTDAKKAACHAYEYADAMMEARKL